MNAQRVLRSSSRSWASPPAGELRRATDRRTPRRTFPFYAPSSKANAGRAAHCTYFLRCPEVRYRSHPPRAAQSRPSSAGPRRARKRAEQTEHIPSDHSTGHSGRHRDTPMNSRQQKYRRCHAQRTRSMDPSLSSTMPAPGALLCRSREVRIAASAVPTSVPEPSELR